VSPATTNPKGRHIMSDQLSSDTWVIRDYSTVKPETIIERTEFISAIIDSVWESYDWWVGVDYNNIPDSDDQPFLKVAVIDPDGDDDSDLVHRVLTVQDIYNGYISACSAQKQDIGFEDYGDGDYDLDIDADAGDVIIQFAVFGAHIYG
jgi:hypothetical protein